MCVCVDLQLDDPLLSSLLFVSSLVFLLAVNCESTDAFLSSQRLDERERLKFDVSRSFFDIPVCLLCFSRTHLTVHRQTERIRQKDRESLLETQRERGAHLLFYRYSFSSPAPVLPLVCLLLLLSCLATAGRQTCNSTISRSRHTYSRTHPQKRRREHIRDHQRENSSSTSTLSHRSRHTSSSGQAT